MYYKLKIQQIQHYLRWHGQSNAQSIAAYIKSDPTIVQQLLIEMNLCGTVYRVFSSDEWVLTRQ